MGQILDSLNTILANDQIVEMRAFSRGRTYSKVFAPDDRATLEVQAGHCFGYEGVYFTLNPLSPTMLTSGGSAKDSDVIRRRILLVDVDPERPTGESATEEEKAKAKEEAEAVQAHLTSLGFPLPIVADSGNGYHLLYRIDLPAEDGGLVHRCLIALKAKFPWVDTTVANASRICKLYGTWARKGKGRPERPHRQSCLLSVPSPWEVVPSEKLEELAKQTGTVTLPAGMGEAPTERKAVQAPLEVRLRQARAFVESAAPAISGRHGHNTTFYVACTLVRGYDLTPTEALPLMQEYNQKCQPPWTDKEVLHKLEDADTKAMGPRGMEVRAGFPETDKYVNARRHVTGPRYTGPTGAGRQEHKKIAQIIVIYYGYDAKGEEALALLEAYNRTHGNLPTPKLREYLDAADKAGGVRGRMWPRRLFDDPYRLALDFLDAKCWEQDACTLRTQGGEWFKWNGTKYVKLSTDDMRGLVTRDIQGAFDNWWLKWVRIVSQPREAPDIDMNRVSSAILTDSNLLMDIAKLKSADPAKYLQVKLLVKAAKISTRDFENALPKVPKTPMNPPDARQVTRRKVDDVIQALAASPYCVPPPEAKGHVVAFINGLLDMDTGELRPHTPLHFSTQCLPFAYDPQASKPEKWHNFLASLWDKDPVIGDNCCSSLSAIRNPV
jgi:hypothetical protein